MSSMMKILNDLTPLNRVFCSSDYDKSIDYLQEFLPFEVRQYPANDEHNGWVIPPKWDVKEAKILKDGITVYDATRHALTVIALSKTFHGKVPLNELKRHLHYDDRYEDAVPFHFRGLYRSWERDWGFCVPKRLYDNLTLGEYEVVIETEESPGVLKVLEYTHHGLEEEIIVIGGNLDHPGVSNDGLAGCVVGIELMQRLRQRKTRFSYRLVLVQGIIGSEYYLGKMYGAVRGKLLEGVFLEMLGSKTPLALQKSREGQSNIEWALARSLDSLGIDYRTGPFQSIILNDEYIWENYGIPMASLSRFPYPEYHCDRDNLSIILEQSLEQAVEVLLKAVEILESSPVVIKTFEGNICLSNPKYDLYVDPGQVAFGDIPDEQRKKMRYLMDMISAIKRPVTVSILAERVGLQERLVSEYLEKWVEKGLLVLK